MARPERKVLDCLIWRSWCPRESCDSSAGDVGWRFFAVVNRGCDEQYGLPTVGGQRDDAVREVVPSE